MHKFGEVLEKVDLKNYNTYKIGGEAKYIIKPYNLDCLRNLVNFLKETNQKFLIIGKGSNIILPDDNYEGVIILLDNLNNYNINNFEVEAEAGIILSLLINKLMENNIGGLENLYGLPGTLGGALINNAGCFGSVISEHLLSVTYLENGELTTIKTEDCDFKYRDSIFKLDKNKIVVSAKFKLYNSNKEEMLNTIKDNMKKRQNSQPLEFPSAGSVFRNPENYSAGMLIEKCGLKNFNINDAYVSDKHANFIINKGNANSEDIINLINIIKEKVKEKYNIELILEQEIVKY